ncbi:opioid-binding protein/cell adhesion molecule-like [Gigantopelta aegis]|uniref:opioid-binding protein/cell adhesion molecule-like n=1 Tax=Gigantopelta aegis TaxID=1735272 RepID=UPI001B88E278|nr:opioid-binding protein/cell adhesion molecule-like [Gigantopelta aegis]
MDEDYDCLVINEAGAERNTSTLYVRPVITEQPDDQYVDDGQAVTLSCKANSFPSPEYQWEMMNRTTRMFEPIKNATDSTFTISSISYNDYGNYRCVAAANSIAENATSEPALITNGSIIERVRHFGGSGGITSNGRQKRTAPVDERVEFGLRRSSNYNKTEPS